MGLLGDPIPIHPDDPQASEKYSSTLTELFAAINNLSLVQRNGTIQNGDKAGNLDAKYVVFTSNGTANTEDAVAHKLGHKPNGYVVVKQDKAATLYDSGTTNTTTYLYVKSSAATVAWTVLVF